MNQTKPLHIAFHHDAVIPPHKYGGTERIIAWLLRELNKMGHRTTLLAREGSRVEGTTCLPASSANWESKLPHDTDLVHLWGTPATTPRIPYLVTIEGNGQPEERFAPNTVFISRKHAENHSSNIFVYNGLDPADYRCEPERDDYLVFLAKASWKVKNLHGAIAIARAAKIRLEVMGSRDLPLGLHRFLPTIRGIHYRGMVDDQEKREVLSRAAGLIFPVRWHEPFGIALTEALASGAPVLGTPYGSLPEIVSSDVGVLSANGNDLVKAIQDIRRGKFKAESCRKRVETYFSARKMAQSYVELYRHVVDRGSLSTNTPNATVLEAPHTAAGFVSEQLLPWQSPSK